MELSRKQTREHCRQLLGRKPPRGLRAEITRHGTAIWVYRAPGVYHQMKSSPGSVAFWQEYTDASRGLRVAAPAQPGLLPSDPNSFAWLVERFLSSSTHLQKEEATRKARKNVLMRIVNRDDGKVGASAFRDITEKDIRSLRDKIATDDGKVPMEDVGKEVDGVVLGKAAMANGTVAILRVLFSWAVDVAQIPGLDRNPCLGVKAFEYAGGTNYVWTDDDIARFEAAYPLGTRERLAFALMLYTGQRSGDIVRMGRQHIRDGWLTIIARKTRKHKSEAAQVPVLDVLAETIAASPTGDLTFLVGENGAPLSVSRFGTWFRAACDKIGLPECTPHGLRHAGATRLASRGADVATFQCIYGWSLAMIERYTRKATRRHSAAKDIHLLNHAA